MANVQVSSWPCVHGLGRISALLATALMLGSGVPAAGAFSGIHKIRHILIVMQENRSFDSYFGTFPGADGITRYAFRIRCGAPACGPTTIVTT